MVTPQHDDPSNTKTVSLIGERRSNQRRYTAFFAVNAAFRVSVESPSPKTDSALILLRRMPASVLTCWGVRHPCPPFWELSPLN